MRRPWLFRTLSFTTTVLNHLSYWSCTLESFFFLGIERLFNFKKTDRVYPVPRLNRSLFHRDYFCEVWFPLELGENYNWAMLLLHVVASVYSVTLAIASMYLYLTLILLLCGQLEYIYNHFNKQETQKIQLDVKHEILSAETSLVRHYSRGVQHHQKVVRCVSIEECNCFSGFSN